MYFYRAHPAFAFCPLVQPFFFSDSLTREAKLWSKLPISLTGATAWRSCMPSLVTRISTTTWYSCKMMDVSYSLQSLSTNLITSSASLVRSGFTVLNDCHDWLRVWDCDCLLRFGYVTFKIMPEFLLNQVLGDCDISNRHSQLQVTVGQKKIVIQGALVLCRRCWNEAPINELLGWFQIPWYSWCALSCSIGRMSRPKPWPDLFSRHW